jgi:Effector-associated domain 7
MNPTKAELDGLRRLLDYCFNENELRDLCLDWGIDYENLGGGNKVAWAGELLAYLARKDQFSQLVQTCSQLRPNAPWATPTARYEPYTASTLARLSRMVAEHFDQDQVRDICAALQVDARRLPGVDQGGMARELVLYLARRERIAGLVQVCSQRRTDIPWQDALDRAESKQAMAEAGAQPIDAARLRQMLDAHFTQEQLRDLCLETGIDYDNIPGPDRIRELVQYFERRGSVPELAAACSRLRPDLPW